MPAPLAKLLVVAGAAAGGTTAQQPPDPSLQRPAPLPAVAADNSWRSSLPGDAPPNLKYLGAWTANEYPDYPIHFLNLGLQDAFKFLGPAGGIQTVGPVLDEGALRQAAASAAAGQVRCTRMAG